MARYVDIERMLVEGFTQVTINVLYSLPDQQSLVNEFIWETLDLAPRYPRVHRFLDYWQQKIDGPIRSVRILNRAHLVTAEWRNGLILPL